MRSHVDEVVMSRPGDSGDMAARVRAHDWAATPLGALDAWPERLRGVVDLMLASPLLASVAVGPERVLIYNDASARFYGDRHPAALGRPLGETFPESFPAVAPLYDRVFAGEAVTVAAQPLDVRDEGSGEMFDAYLTPVRGDDGSVIAAHMTGFEVGTRVRAETALRDSEEERRSLIAQMNEGFCILEVILDEAGNGVDYRFLETNPAFVRQGGFDPAGRLMSEIAPIEPVWPAAYGRVATTGVPERIVDAAAAFGRTYDVYAFRIGDPAHRRIAVFFSDITARKTVEAALRESEARQAFLLELTDKLRPLTEPGEIEREATRLLGEHLQADRCFLSPVYDDGSGMCVREEYLRSGASSVLGDYTFAQFGDFVGPTLHAGRILAVENVAALTGLSAEERESYAATEIDAYLLVPVTRNGRLAAFLTINHRTPHPWSDADKAVARQTADRLWPARERALAEAAVRESEERFRQFGEASQDVLWIRDAATLQWTYLTPAFETIYGLGRDEALANNDYRNWLDLIVPEDRERAAACIDRVRHGEWVTFECRVRRPVDGAIAWLRNTDFPIKDGKGRVTHVGGIGHDITAVKRIEHALAAAKRRQQVLVDGIPQLVWRADDPGEWTWASPQWTAYTGQAEPDSHGWGWLEPVHPDDRETAREAWDRALAAGELEVEYRLLHAGDGYRWFQTRAAPVRDADGEIIEWLGTSTDIDDARHLQERQQVLLAELQHRVRNILTVVRSVFNRTAERSGDLEDLLDHFRGRLDALARTQVIVTQTESGGVDLENLIRDELLSVGIGLNGNDGVTVAGPDVLLPPKTAESLGLAIHELTTNALKYGALKVPAATLDINWATNLDDSSAPRLDFIWTEQGVPAVPIPPSREGFGRELIENALPYRLGAKTRLEFKGGGVQCHISVPMAPGGLDTAGTIG